MDDLDKTMAPRREHTNSGADDVTMPGKRDRKPDGRFAVGDLIVNRYKVLAELGQGGMGVVYKCFDETAGIEVALKALPPELSHNTLEMEDIKDNFQLVHNLHHPNIASSNTLERDDSNGNYYLIMECCDGEDLRRWIKRKRKEGALTLDDVLPIIQQVADALDYAHEQKIIHRDIKPGNIMIDARGRIKVLDFGLAAQIHTSMTRVSMAYHGTSGTGPYMAPEQWRGKKQGTSSDQYSLAVMTYEMLSGDLPFESSDVAVLREAVLHEYADPIPNISQAAHNTLKRAMSKIPDERFGSCAHFVAALNDNRVCFRIQYRKFAILWILLVITAIVWSGKYLFLDKIFMHKQNSTQESGITKGNRKSILSHSTWSPGIKHPENGNLIADASEGIWKSIKPGYVWTEGSKIAWSPGIKHPENGNLVADTQKDIWRSTKPGYVWDNNSGIRWKSDVRHPENEDLVTDVTEGIWKSIKPGYEWDGASGVRWHSGIISRDGTRKTATEAGKWLFKRNCSGCGGNGEISKIHDCTYCNGSGKQNSEIQCTSCNGRKQWTELENCKSCNGSGSKKIQSVCSACQGNPFRKCTNPRAKYVTVYETFHVIPCSCRGRGCIQCGLSGFSMCRECDGRGNFRCSNYACSGGKEYKTIPCSDCSGGQCRVIRRCNLCYGSGKISRKNICSFCSGSGKQQRHENCSRCEGKKFIWEL